MRINHNMMAMNTHRMLGINSDAGSKSIEKLSSGLRINRAGDDAAGLTISEKMRSQVRGLNQASSNAQDGISMIQTAEGALSETENILQRMRELSVQGSNDTLATEDRTAIGQELKDLTSEIDRISKTTEFNGKKLLDGSLSTELDGTTDIEVGASAGVGSVISSVDVSGAKAATTYTIDAYTAADDELTMQDASGNSQTIALASDTQTLNFSSFGISIQLTGTADADIIGAAMDDLDLVTAAGDGAASFAIGSNGTAEEKISVAFDKFDMTTLGTGNVGDATKLTAIINAKNADAVITSSADADGLTTTIDDAIKQVSEQRSKLGASQNRLEHTIINLDTSAENLQAAESRIRDVDMAKEMMEFTKNNILQQAAQSMLAQANQAPEGVLQLLR